MGRQKPNSGSPKGERLKSTETNGFTATRMGTDFAIERADHGRADRDPDEPDKTPGDRRGG